MISNTFQTNTFIEGMDCDTDITMLPNNRYRYAENIRILTNSDGTSGVLQNINGILNLVELFPSDITILGVVTVDKYIVIVTKDSTGRNIFTRYEVIDGTVSDPHIIIKGYFGIEDNLSIVGNYESDSVIKVYFTDGKSPVKILNILEDKYNNPDSGLIDDNGDVINIEAFDITPGAVLPPFKLTSMGVGSLPAGVVQYCYLLFNLRNSETTISALSRYYHLAVSTTDQDSLDYMGSNKGESSAKSVSLSAELTTKDFEKCRVIRILYEENNQPPTITIVNEINIDTSKDTIEYTDTGNSFMGELTVDEFNALTGYLFIASTLTKMDNRLFAADVTDYTWDPGYYDARAYRANKDGQVLLQHSDSSLNLTFDIDTYDLTTIPVDHDCINPTNYSQLSIPNSECYEYGNKIGTNGGRLYGGHGPNIDYTFVYGLINIADTPDGSVTDSPLVSNRCDINTTPITMLNGVNLYTVGDDSAAGYFMFNDELITNRLFNYADPDTDASLKGYFRDEVYRFGIIFYNSKSIPSPVYWIGDIKMPHANACAPFTYDGKLLRGRALGLKFTVRNVPEGAVAYEIVRCDRTELDRSILMLAVGQYIYEYRIQENSDFIGKGTALPSSVEMRPPAIFYNRKLKMCFGGPSVANNNSIAKECRTDTDLIKSSYYRIVSPEICLQKENIELYFNNSCYVDKIGCAFSPTTAWRPGDEGQEGDSSIRITATCFRALQPDGTLPMISTKAYVTSDPDGSGNYMWVSPTSQVSLGIPGVEVLTGTGYYKAEIARYYVTAYSKRLEDDMSFVEEAVYPPIIPYNNTLNCAAYTINIGDNTYANYAMTEFISSENQAFFGPAGPCVIIKSSNIVDYIGSSDLYLNMAGTYNNMYSFNGTPIVNIKVIPTNPYGGNTYTSRLDSVYISINSYSLIDDNSTEYTTFTYGGDTYLGVLDYPNCMIFLGNTVEDRREYKLYIGSYIPFETSVNLNLMNGDMPHRTWDVSNGYLDSHLQIEPQQTQVYHIQDRPFYAYNAVYSSLPGARIFVPKSIYAESNMHNGNRIMVSLAKVNNEILDNWTLFKVADYLDVDSLYGTISNLYTFKNRLFYFLNNAVGIASVNERSLITDENNNQVVLGTGGILSRYDYITTVNGSSVTNDKSITNSDNILYWYDKDKNELCAYDGRVNSLSKEKNVLSYLYSLPVLERLVKTSFFDKKYNELWISFPSKSLIFNELIGRFTSFYTYNPDWVAQFSDTIYTIKDNVLHRDVLDEDLDKDIIRQHDDAKLLLIVNKDSIYTKTFDNVSLSGELEDSDGNNMITGLVSNITFKTKHLASLIDEPVFDYRENSYRLPIPRESVNDDPLSFPGRMKGKCLTCDYTFNTNDENTFKIPYITTTYRYSLI